MALSRRRKVVLLLVVFPLVLIALLLAALLTPAVQTFAARKVLAGQGGSVDHVAVGMSGASLDGFRLEQPGLKLVVPSLRADAPLSKLAGGKVELRSLVARDVVVEFDPAAAAQVPKASTEKTPAESKSKKPFDGVLNAAELPELKVDGIDIAGRVRVGGAQPVDATFTLTGGGIRAGETGQVVLKIEAKAGLGSVVTTFTLAPELGADGRLDALSAIAEAFATSKYLAQPAKLRASVNIARESVGESYALRLLAGEAPLVTVDTRWAPGAAELPGRWKMALTDKDLAPFVLGLALPEFALTGGGELAVSGSEKLRASGDVNLNADGLEILGLPKLGPVAVASRFAVEAAGNEARVESLKLEVKGSAPVLAVETRQPFSVALDTKKILPSRAGGDLADILLLGVPAEWLTAFAPGVSVSGPVTGAWGVRPEGDGFVLSSTQPLVAPGLGYASAGKPLVAFEAVRVEDVKVKRTSAGLEATLGRLRVVADGADVVTGKVEASQAPGAPLAAKGELRAVLAKLADQPALRGQTRLSAGQAVVSFDATLADTVKALARLRLSGLRAAGAGDLPELSLDAEVTRAASGAMNAKLPLSVRNVVANRVSDLLLEAVVSSGKPDTRVDAKLKSQVLFVEDLQAFAALAAEKAKPTAQAPAPAASPSAAQSPAAAGGPLWAGVTGELELALARIVYAPGVEVVNTNGRLALTRDAASLEKLQAILGTGGSLDVKGALRWLAGEKQYSLGAEVKGAGVATGPLFKALNPEEAPKLEGNYDLAATVAGRGSDPGAAAASAAAEFKLTGKQGVIRAINLETNKYAKAGSLVSGLAGLAGALSGNAEISQRAGQIAALNDVARAFANLAYNEIALEAKRAADGSVEIGKLNLLSSQLRLAGVGGLRAVAGRSWMELPLNLRFDVGARGDLAGNLAALRVLAPAAADAPADAYREMIEPLVFDGTLKQVGTKQVTRLLTKGLGL